MDKQLEKAVKEIQKIKDKYDALYREFGMMKIYAKSLEEKIRNFDKPLPPISNKEKWDKEAEAAMERYTAKLKKEGLKYAKQKQSQRKPSGEASSKSSKRIGDQSNSSICK